MAAAKYPGQDRAKKWLSGYASGGDVAQDKRMIKSAVRQHEVAQHGGKHDPLKLARGGSVKKPSTTVNVIVASNPSGGEEKALRGSMQRGMHAPPVPAVGGPGGAMPPMASPPPPIGPVGMAPNPLGAAPMRPGAMPGGPPMLKRGGRVPPKVAMKGAKR